MIYDNILGTIGRTPVVRLQRLAPPGISMYVKCEFFNPMPSVKERLAIGIIQGAQRHRRVLDLRIEALVARVETEAPHELIFALAAAVEGEAKTH